MVFMFYIFLYLFFVNSFFGEDFNLSDSNNSSQKDIDEDNYDFQVDLFRAKQLLYSDDLLIGKLKSLNVEKNLFSKNEINSLFSFFNSNILPFYRLREDIKKQIIIDYKKDIFNMAENLFFTKQVDLEKSLIITHGKNINSVIFNAIFPVGNSKLQVKIYEDFIKEKNRRLLDLASNEDEIIKLEKIVQDYDKNTQDIKDLMTKKTDDLKQLKSGFFKTYLPIFLSMFCGYYFRGSKRFDFFGKDKVIDKINEETLKKDGLIKSIVNVIMEGFLKDVKEIFNVKNNEKKEVEQVINGVGIIINSKYLLEMSKDFFSAFSFILLKRILPSSIISYFVFKTPEIIKNGFDLFKFSCDVSNLVYKRMGFYNFLFKDKNKYNFLNLEKFDEKKIKLSILKYPGLIFKNENKIFDNHLKKNINRFFDLRIFEKNGVVTSFPYKQFNGFYDRLIANRIDSIRAQISSARFIRENIILKKDNERAYSVASCPEKENDNRFEIVSGFKPELGSQVVKNDLILGGKTGNALIVGPTGAGKTLFMQTAQTINFYNKICGVVPAKKYFANLYEPIIYFDIPFIENHSNFQKEARLFFEYLLNKINNEYKNKKGLFSFDEIFRSTSEDQAFEAFNSPALKEYLLKNRNCHCLVSTHFKRFLEMIKDEENSFKIVSPRVDFVKKENGDYDFNLTYAIGSGQGWWFNEEHEGVKKQYSNFLRKNQMFKKRLLNEIFDQK
jgi:hypothetical protein